MVTEVAVEAVKMEVVLEGNSKETVMPESAVRVVDNAEKVGLEAKAAGNVAKVVLEAKEVLREKVVVSDVKVASKRKAVQVLLIANRHLENRSRENHNQFKESISQIWKLEILQLSHTLTTVRQPL